MQINFHSPDALLTDELKEYFEEKLTKPIERFKMDPETVRFDVDAGLHHESVGLRIRLSVPGLTIVTPPPPPKAPIPCSCDLPHLEVTDAQTPLPSCPQRA